jgi:hypothetical protein
MLFFGFAHFELKRTFETTFFLLTYYENQNVNLTVDC